jgi:hypothetical protein
VPEPYRLLVTGSREWDRPDIIRAGMLEVQETAVARLVVVHGMCDPRHPDTRTKIPWAAAMRLGLQQQRQLLGADWLADVVACELGWDMEPHAADWKRYKKAAGFRRNADMVKLGAGECHAYLGPCVKPGCADPQPHASHGGAHCAGLAEKAGIKTRTFMASSLPVTAAPQEETR